MLGGKGARMEWTQALMPASVPSLSLPCCPHTCGVVVKGEDAASGGVTEVHGMPIWAEGNTVGAPKLVVQNFPHAAIWGQSPQAPNLLAILCASSRSSGPFRAFFFCLGICLGSTNRGGIYKPLTGVHKSNKALFKHGERPSA